MKSIINVILIIHSAGVGGVEKRFLNLFKHMSSAVKSSAFHYTFYFNRRFLSRVSVEKVKVQNENVGMIVYGVSERWEKYFLSDIVVRLVDWLHLWFVLLRRKCSRNIDIVHFVTIGSLRFRSIFLGTKKITSFYNGGSTRTGIKERLYKSAFKEDIYFDCLSSDISSILIDEANVPADKVFTSPCSFIDVEDTFFDPRVKDRIVSFVARLNKQKGVRLLLKSITDVAAEIQDIKFYIIGYGPLEMEIKNFIGEHNLQDNVFLFFCPNPKEVLIKSLVFLSLQKNDNYPSQSLLEAMACGNAVIATNVGLTKQLVDDSNGILIQDNQEELTSAIITLLNSQEATLLKCSNSRQKVLLDHTVDRFLAYLNDLYARRLGE